MDKIETMLLTAIKLNPKKSFDVLLCTTIDSKLKNDKWQKLIDGVYTATIKGEEIEKLAEHKDILSIEQDSEMEIF